MNPFTYVRATDTASAVRAAAPPPGAAKIAPTEAPAQYLAGGTTILDLMKLGMMRPETLVDISPLRSAGSAGSGRIEAGASGLRFGALTSMAAAADHPVVQRDYPVIYESLWKAASAQLRNMASLGGNVLQRTRCVYFRDPRPTSCNKRVPGSGCSAIDGGVTRQHALLGTSDQCIASYPGDFALALIALDATLELQSAGGTTRRLPFAMLHTKPGNTPKVETVLAPGELITSIEVPAGPWTRRSRYVKVRDRDSYQFAVCSAAVALDLQGGNTVKTVRIALGGVATVPWRATEAEAALAGRTLDETAANAAAELAFANAVTYPGNAFKVELGKRTLVRALLEAGQMTT